VGSEDLLGGGLGDTVREGELEVLLEKLLQVRTLDVGRLLNLDNLENLYILINSCPMGSGHSWPRGKHT